MNKNINTLQDLTDIECAETEGGGAALVVAVAALALAAIANAGTINCFVQGLVDGFNGA